MVMSEDITSEITTEDLAKPDVVTPFTVEVLKLIKDCHQQHGLRHGDYQRYRGYCTRRIARLRHVLKIPQGDRRHYKKRDVTEAHINSPKSDERLLHIPLMLAERDWAYAMQLRQEANTEPRKKFHFIQKLRKACAYSLLLEDLCKLERCDARTKLESQAYVAWMHGTLHFELQLWSQATENLKKSQMIYEKLASALPEDEQACYKQRVDEITPSLRYCAYNIGDDKAVDLLELRSQGILENFDTLVSQTKEKTSAVLHEIQWYDMKVPIRMDRVKIFLLAIENLDESINRAESTQAKIKIIEDMFIDLRDIIAEVRKDPKENLLLAYLLSIRVDRTVQRNLLLIKQTKKPQDVCRLLDIIVQQVSEAQQNTENPRAQGVYVARVVAYRALRAFYMAKTHALFRRWQEATATFDVCAVRIGEARAGLAQFDAILVEMVDEVGARVPLELAIAHANVVLEKHEEDEAPVPQKQYKSKKPLMERLDEFREDPQLLTRNPNVVPVPMPMTAVAPKPLFYDLALNYVQMPVALQEMMEGTKKEHQTAGISGFVKGLWGWGKK